MKMIADDRLLLADSNTGRINTICSQRMRTHVMKQDYGLFYRHTFAWPARETDHSPPPSGEVMCELYLHSPISHHAFGV
jgi:hypothetical protein